MAHGYYYALGLFLSTLFGAILTTHFNYQVCAWPRSQTPTSLSLGMKLVCACMGKLGIKSSG